MKYDVFFSSHSEREAAKAALHRADVQVESESSSKLRTGEITVQKLARVQARFKGRVEPVSDHALLACIKNSSRLPQRPFPLGRRVG